MADRRTTYHARSVELVDFVRENRARLVLKPNDDYGGTGYSFDRSWTSARGTPQSRRRFRPITSFRRRSIFSRRSFQSLTRPSGNFSRCSLIRTHFSFAEKSAARWFAYPPRQSSTLPPEAVRQASLFCSEYAAQRFSNTTAQLKGDNGFASPFKGRG